MTGDRLSAASAPEQDRVDALAQFLRLYSPQPRGGRNWPDWQELARSAIAVLEADRG